MPALLDCPFFNPFSFLAIAVFTSYLPWILKAHLLGLNRMDPLQF
jgi:hypothetical protein